MRRTLIQGVAAVGIAAIFASPAGAQPPTPTPRAPGAVTGEMWMSATPDVRRAFLAGAGNMIALETAYARRKNIALAAPDSAVAAAMQGMTLDQIAGRVTRWYEANPGRRGLPVMGVVWLDLVAPRTAAK